MEDYLVVGEELLLVPDDELENFLSSSSKAPIPSKPQKTILESNIIRELGWETFLTADVQRDLLKHITKEPNPAVSKWFNDQCDHLKENAKIHMKWLVASSRGTKNSFWRFPKTEETLARRRTVVYQMIHFVSEKYSKNYDPVQCLEFLFGESPPRTKQAMITLFIAGLFLSKNPAAASADTMLKIAKDVLWIFRFFTLVQYYKDDQFTEEDFWLQTSSEKMNAFSSINAILKIASATSKRNVGDKMPRVIPTFVDHEVVVDGIILKSQFIHEYYHSLLGAAKKLYHGLWLKQDSKEIELSQIRDDISFFDVVENSLFQFLIVDKDHLKNPTNQAILLRNFAFNNLKTQMKSGNSWIEDKIIEWTKNADKFLEYLISLIHIGGGGPPRATDYLSLSLCNSTQNQRTIFFLKDHGLVTCLKSQKTQEVLGGMS